MAVKVIAATDYDDAVNTIAVSGTGVKTIRKVINILATDDDTSAYLICQLPAGAILLDIVVRNAAITAGDDYDIGLYNSIGFGGDVIDADYFADGLDLSSAHIRGAEISGIAALAVGLGTERVFEHSNTAGTTTFSSGEKTVYDLVLTGNTVGTAAGAIEIDVSFVGA